MVTTPAFRDGAVGGSRTEGAPGRPMPRPYKWVGANLLVILLATTHPSPSVAACRGDCNRDAAVTVNELVVGVNIALGTSSIGACLNFDRNADAAVTIDELLEAVRDTLNGCTSTPEPVFPTTYRATFTEVRTCRFSTEHGGVNVRVWANAIGAQPYLANANPLPVGSVVVKEEFNGSACDDADLNGWRVMRKEAPGFDPVDGDWHWQWVNADRTVRVDDKQTCIGCHVRPACLARDRMCTEPGGPPRGTLTTVLRDLPAAHLVDQPAPRPRTSMPSVPTRPRTRSVRTSCTTTANAGTG